MENLTSLAHEILAAVVQTMGLAMFIAILFFPEKLEGTKKGAKLEQCPSCGKWKKSE